MLKVKFERYWDDNHCQNDSISFSGGLASLEEWIFSQMLRDYSGENGRHTMSFPTPSKVEQANASGPWTIKLYPSYNSPSIWIHLIENDKGVIFSDGQHTAGKKHWSQEVKNWLTHCEERRHSPVFNFVE